jgi:hypothetical protein
MATPSKDCLICGRGAACLGCRDEFKVLCATITPASSYKDPAGRVVAVPAHPTYTLEQAAALARNNHVAREQAAGDAQVAARLANCAAGKDADTGVPFVIGTALQVSTGLAQFTSQAQLDAAKAQAQAAIDARAALAAPALAAWLGSI